MKKLVKCQKKLEELIGILVMKEWRPESVRALTEERPTEEPKKKKMKMMMMR